VNQQFRFITTCRRCREGGLVFDPFAIVWAENEIAADHLKTATFGMRIR
jgi:hypothetical protein